jgi:hypothetical protein
VLFIYIKRLTSNEIFSPSHKIHREVGRARDLSAPRGMFPAKVLCRNGTHISWPIIFFPRSLRYVKITERNSYLCYVALQPYNWNSKSNFLTSHNRHGIHSQEPSSWCEVCNYSAEHILFILLFLKRTHVVVFHKLYNKNKFNKFYGFLTVHHSIDLNWSPT